MAKKSKPIKPIPKKKSIKEKRQENIKIISKLLKAKRGNISAVARSMKLNRSTVHEHIHKHPELLQMLNDSRERMLDDAEDKLGTAIRKGEAWAVCFTLKTVGKKRGFVERQEISITDVTKLTDKELEALASA